MKSAGRGWYVPRSLPHFDSPEVVQAITFRLIDSLPKHVAAPMPGEAGSDRRRRIALALDRGLGRCVLKHDKAALAVESTLLAGAGRDYGLHAWTIMPNHVHVLVQAFVALPKLVQTWKSVSARTINDAIGSSGPVWQKEYFDRFIRDEAHWNATVEYIEQNPVKAGLVARAEEWRYGSAWWRCTQASSVDEEGGGGAAPPK